VVVGAWGRHDAPARHGSAARQTAVRGVPPQVGGSPGSCPARASPQQVAGGRQGRGSVLQLAVWESPDPGDDAAPGRVQGEHHGDTPAVKGENVADDGSQWKVEGGDHRLLLQLDPRSQQPPVEPGGPGPRPPPRPGGPCRPAPAPVTAGPPPRTGAAAARPTHPRSTPRHRGGHQLLNQAATRTLRPCSRPPPWRRRSPPRRAARKAGWSAARPRLASRPGHRPMRTPADANDACGRHRSTTRGWPC
jgi:hypothetical protein